MLVEPNLESGKLIGGGRTREGRRIHFVTCAKGGIITASPYVAGLHREHMKRCSPSHAMGSGLIGWDTCRQLTNAVFEIVPSK